MFTKRLILFVVFLLTVSGSSFVHSPVYAQGVMPVHVPLIQTESEHFIYIYEQPLKDRMSDLIKNCEDAHRLLSPVFNWTPKEKTIVMYSDAQDIHNGWATVYPRPMILVYASDAPPGSTIYEPGDYIRRTIFHEYAHVLSMDAQYGTDGVLTRIFGRVFALQGDPLSFILMLLAAPPGVLAPVWYKEGLAIWAETEFVGPGRGRSSRVDMIMRMAVHDKRVLKGNEWFLELPEWPYTTAAYLYGLKAIEYIHDVYGFKDKEKNAPGEVSDSVSHSFMFSFDKRARSVTGKSFSQLAFEAMAEERSRQAARIEKLKTKPITRIKRLTPERLIVTEPKFGADGEFIYFSGREESDRNSLLRYDTRTMKLHKLISARTTLDLYTDLTASPDRQTIYYTRLNVQGRDRVRNELHALNTHNEKSRIVAKKGRYRYPVISPDGTRMATVVNRAGKQSLIEVPLKEAGREESEKVLTTLPLKYSLLDPTYSPDGRSIVYIQADEKTSQIRRIEINSGRNEELVTWPCIILTPVFPPAGKNLLFVSDKNGVYNLYRMSFGPNAEPVALTNVLGGIFNPDFSSDGKLLTLTGYDSYGYYLSVVSYEDLHPLDFPLPTVDDDWKSLASNRSKIQSIEQEPAPKTTAAKPYNSFGTIGFDYWSPWFSASEDGVMGGFSAHFSDPTQFQNLYLVGGVESEYKTPIGALIYQYSGLYPIFTLYGLSEPETYTDLVLDENNVYYDYDEEVRTAGVSISLPLLRVDWQSYVNLGYEVSDRSVINESADEYRGKSLVTHSIFDGTECSLWSQVNFFNGTAFGRSHSVEDGRYLAATVQWSDGSLGSDIDRTRVRGDWYEYITLPWAENHVLKLEGTYAVGSGDKSAQGLFGLGGYAPSLTPVPGLDRNILLRGYSSNYQVGDEVVKAGAAYRFPIYKRYRNINTTSPFYIQQLFGEVFYEGGKATGGDIEGQDNKWINAAGLELNVSTTLFRFLPISPGIGVAYAFDRGDRNRRDDDDDNDDKWQFYISIKTTVNF